MFTAVVYLLLGKRQMKEPIKILMRVVLILILAQLACIALDKMYHEPWARIAARWLFFTWLGLAFLPLVAGIIVSVFER